MQKRFLILIYSLFVLQVNAASAPKTNNPTKPSPNAPVALQIYQNKVQFDALEANKIFDQTNIKLSTQNLNVKDLNSAIKLFKKLNADAEDCIDITQQQIDNINTIQQTNNVPTNETTKTTPVIENTELTPDQAYLNNELKKITNHQAECRLFTIRASEVINAYQAKVAEIKKQETFRQTPPIWEYIPSFLALWQQGQLFKETLTLEAFQFEWKKWLFNALFSISIASMIVWIFTHRTQLKRIFRIKSDYLTWELSIFLSLWLNLNWLSCTFQKVTLSNSNYICTLFQILAIFSILVLINTVFFSIKRVRALFYWYELDFNYFYNLINIIICLTTLNNISDWLKNILLPNKITSLIFQSSFLFIIIFFNITLFFQFLRKHRHFTWVQKYKKTLQSLNLIFFLGCLTCNMVGYHILAMRLVFSSLTTLLIVFLSILFIQAFQKLYQSILTGPLHQKTRYFFGYKENQSLTEFFILKLTLQILTVILGLYWIGESMGFISFYITKLYQPLFEGISLGNITLHPSRIICGIVIFCGMFLIFRSISTAITRTYQSNEEEDTQVAIASILNYIGFAIALISALLVAGFDFTGLAIVAGALSVGIGLGLQSIVNNFVSGLILLIEKPIKPGDRINVDGVEGVVKKIRVRSTQIITSAREDIIVPNSDLVTRRVTNYMYTDKYLSIFCRIPIPYDADVKLVEKLLLDAANHNDEVVKSGRNKPSVLLKSFGDVGLIFELWCLIKDANKKSNVQSELNYTILNLLGEHNIEIPVHQQHLYLHSPETNG
jgi:small-conductance mechanosensitive channel